MAQFVEIYDDELNCLDWYFECKDCGVSGCGLGCSEKHMRESKLVLLWI